MEPIFWSLILLALGVLLVVLEVFVPSGGLLSILAAVSVVAAVVVGYLGGLVQGTLVLLGSAVLIPITLFFAVRLWPQTPLGRLILNEPPSEDEVLPDDYDQLRRLVGAIGRAQSKLLPSGAVRIGKKTYDAISNGVPIEAGEPVIVAEVRGRHIVVRPASDLEQESSSAQEALLERPIDALGVDPFEET